MRSRILSEASRSPKSYWEQMLPKKFPTPSSSPSKGTNSVTTSSTTVEINQNILSSDGKILNRAIIVGNDTGSDFRYKVVWSLTISLKASRSPMAYWEQMLPNKFPTPSFSPSKGTNSVSTSSTAVATDQNFPSSDGNV
ncbi:hypothetical protein RJ639_000061 [Escallonia herrerae]|uniref:Uncharacterized protein n=1 Tax=Escallonia herrerae TaxID=1293975 RepID=A0AA88XJM1_9ASTE|nr:hypothetical protein RJ639_000061 [Escallonia herrerae]